MNESPALLLSPSTPARAVLATALGPLELRGTEAGLSAVGFLASGSPGTATPAGAVPACLRAAHEQLQAYFGGELRAFTVLTAVVDGTEFQRRVWAALLAVAYGRTASYLDLARQLDNPGAVRAVGAANGQNPLAIIWPCHRIIGSGGQLTGYAGGLERKKWLLELESPPRQLGLFASERLSP
ncbi:methylated-DNA--[protein]-cysteine S-methyltransferase [Hymenobacter actinosclerus]|uniref:Methylated-DNA--protein-cysteine methyltransferase n=1 Tax=Hymenobacter actinosclerus TaxID=82805 RepID=A0A1I0I3D6_9BACT|nr:methylated-DNA--[protein]-cysteine S-methyltransferase [Hymenobacter actinosclerus]SET91028.1 methylated-DNA-[protein]-cysteine S-methyltransferase [Hymenobacter actinosclerus]